MVPAVCGRFAQVGCEAWKHEQVEQSPRNCGRKEGNTYWGRGGGAIARVLRLVCRSNVVGEGRYGWSRLLVRQNQRLSSAGLCAVRVGVTSARVTGEYAGAEEMAGWSPQALFPGTQAVVFFSIVGGGEGPVRSYG